MNAVAERTSRQPKSHDFTTASYNVSPEKRVQAFARLTWLMTTHRTLTGIGLQEAWWVRVKPIPIRASKRGWRRARRRHGDTQFLFRNARGFEGISSGVYNLAAGVNHWIEPRAAGPTKADQRRIEWVAGRQDGVPTVKGSLHLVPSQHLDRADALAEEQIEDICAFVTYWQAHGFAVMLVGDFNAEPKSANMRPLLSLMHIANRGATHGSRQIDYILVTDEFIVVGDRTIPGHRKDDHRIPLVRCRMRSTEIRKAWLKEQQRKKRK